MHQFGGDHPEDEEDSERGNGKEWEGIVENDSDESEWFGMEGNNDELQDYYEDNFKEEWTGTQNHGSF